MAARDEQQQDRVESDSASPGGSRTSRAVSLARLLHRESSLLLQLWVSCVAELILSRYLRVLNAQAAIFWPHH